MNLVRTMQCKLASGVRMRLKDALEIRYCIYESGPLVSSEKLSARRAFLPFSQ